MHKAVNPKGALKAYILNSQEVFCLMGIIMNFGKGYRTSMLKGNK